MKNNIGFIFAWDQKILSGGKFMVCNTGNRFLGLTILNELFRVDLTSPWWTKSNIKSVIFQSNGFRFWDWFVGCIMILLSSSEMLRKTHFSDQHIHITLKHQTLPHLAWPHQWIEDVQILFWWLCKSYHTMTTKNLIVA